MKLGDIFSLDAASTIFQPRLAMTAAMAFFSIALTLNLAGVRLRDLRAANFGPSGVRRTVADVGASASRQFENSRVVYKLESRVSELRGDDAR
jgi:soluble lytic murein transglycosylase-like protein